ncbi:MAG: ATP-grasp domain-containing protein [Phycisphaeraceae bacterium]
MSRSPMIILGASARAAAESARRAGYEPWAIDLFGDRDLREIAWVRVCPRDQYPAAMLRLMRDAPPDAAVLLTGAMENHPQLIEAVAFSRPLVGASAEAIRQVRDPLALPTLKPTRGLKLCKTRRGAGLMQRLGGLLPFTRTKYLVKPYASAGGAGIRFWEPGSRVGRDEYLQQYVGGTPCSAVFHSDGWSSRLLGATEQLLGETAFGARQFQYCGSIGPLGLTETAREALSHLGVQLAQRFDLRGPFGVDFIQDWRGRFWPVEVNPRYVASAEVLEKSRGIAVLAPVGKSAKGKAAPPVGKAILFARSRVRVGDLYELFPADELADVPEPGRLVDEGDPVCTLFARGPSRDACFEQLREKAKRVYAWLDEA